jgi:hypothetical protein
MVVQLLVFCNIIADFIKKDIANKSMVSAISSGHTAGLDLSQD